MKSKRIVNRKILDAARGERCTLEIPGVCNGNPETTIAAHAQFEGGITGGKTDDVSVCFACSSCHEFVDGYRIEPEHRWYHLGRGVVRTLKRLVELGLITLPGGKRT